MTEPTPARQRRCDERLSRVIEWLQENRAAFGSESGRVWVEWTFEKVKVGIETQTEGNVGTRSH